MLLPRMFAGWDLTAVELVSVKIGSRLQSRCTRDANEKVGAVIGLMVLASEVPC